MIIKYAVWERKGFTAKVLGKKFQTSGLTREDAILALLQLIWKKLQAGNYSSFKHYQTWPVPPDAEILTIDTNALLKVAYGNGKAA